MYFVFINKVNESELERTLSEAHHKRTSIIYHTNEVKVQQLQKELKRSIAKSRYRIFSFSSSYKFFLNLFLHVCMMVVQDTNR